MAAETEIFKLSVKPDMGIFRKPLTFSERLLTQAF